MGVSKHGNDSAGRKACKRYKESGRLLTNKASKAERVEKAKASGKHFRNARRTLKPSVVGEQNYRMIKFENLINTIKIEKPMYSERVGRIIWGLRK